MMAIIADLLVLLTGFLMSSTAARIINTVGSSCRPDAMTFCELPVISSLSEEPYPAFPGEEFRLLCQAYGSPTPIIAWFRVLANGESIDVPTSPGHHIINDAGTLRIPHVVPHDDGKYFCMASNSVGDSRTLIEIKVSHPMVSLIPLSVGDTFITLTWNGTVHISSESKQLATASASRSTRHHHHVETRYRLSRHLVLKYRPYKDHMSGFAPPVTATVKLTSTARDRTVASLSPNTAYEFCIEFQPNNRPSTLLDCLIIRTTPTRSNNTGQMGYHQGHTILFLLLVVIVGGVSCVCFGCYAVAVGRKLTKHRSERGFSSLGYNNQVIDDDHLPNYQHSTYHDDNPRKPLIARI